jgi:hypothetical protein
MKSVQRGADTSTPPSTLGFTVIDPQPYVLTISLQARIAENGTFDDVSALLGQTH